MFWLALLVVALAGFGQPRRALSRTFRSSSLELIKGVTFVGIAAFFIFGFSEIGQEMNFFFALLPAVGVWIGVLAGLEQLRRKGPSDDQTVIDAVQVDPVWQQRRQRQQERSSRHGKLFSKDPWGVLASQKRAPDVPARMPEPLPGMALDEPEPVIEEYGPTESALLSIAAENAANGTDLDAPDPPVEKPQTAEARSDFVGILKQHLDQQTETDPDNDEETESDQDAAQASEPEAVAEAAQEPAAAAESAAASEESATEWMKEELPPAELDLEISGHKSELEAKPLEAQSGKYRYKPRLVKSLFADRDD